MVEASGTWDRSPTPARRGLLSDPSWPVYVLFLGLPIWWVLGVSHFMWPIAAAVMLAGLLLRRRVDIPLNAVLWMLFVAWMLVTAVQLDTSGRMMGFALRFSFYAGAGIFLLWLLNSRQITSRAILFSLAGYWVLVVIGGYLGVIFPAAAFHTPVERVIPGSLMANSYVQDMTYARFSEIQDFLGYPLGRPTTFFTYTNGWGSGFGLLAPFAVAAMIEARTRLTKRFFAVMLVLSLVPVIVSLNRGLWIGIVVATFYTLFRFIASRNPKAALRTLGTIGAIAVVVTLSPLGGLIGQRLAHGDSNGARTSLYQESFSRVQSSPLLGYGAPRPAEGSGYLDSVGTQGQVLYLVFSHGYPGLLLFFAWLFHAIWRSAASASPAARAGHVALLVAAVQAPFYGLQMQMFIVMAGAALALREVPLPVPRALASRAEGVIGRGSGLRTGLSA